MVVIRIWLCSASRVQQPHRPVSAISASRAANRRILALFRPPGKVASVEPRLLPGQSPSGSKMPLSISMPTALHGKALSFNRPLIGKLSCHLASFRPSASRAFYAILNNRLEVEANRNHPGRRLALWRRVGCHGGRRVLAPPPPGPRPGDASCQKGPPGASPNFDLPPQPREKSQVTSHE